MIPNKGLDPQNQQRARTSSILCGRTPATTISLADAMLGERTR